MRWPTRVQRASLSRNGFAGGNATPNMLDARQNEGGLTAKLTGATQANDDADTSENVALWCVRVERRVIPTPARGVVPSSIRAP